MNASYSENLCKKLRLHNQHGSYFLNTKIHSYIASVWILRTRSFLTSHQYTTYYYAVLHADFFLSVHYSCTSQWLAACKRCSYKLTSNIDGNLFGISSIIIFSYADIFTTAKNISCEMHDTIIAELWTAWTRVWDKPGVRWIWWWWCGTIHCHLFTDINLHCLVLWYMQFWLP